MSRDAAARAQQQRCKRQQRQQQRFSAHIRCFSSEFHLDLCNFREFFTLLSHTAIRKQSLRMTSTKANGNWQTERAVRERERARECECDGVVSSKVAAKTWFKRENSSQTRLNLAHCLGNHTLLFVNYVFTVFPSIFTYARPFSLQTRWNFSTSRSEWMCDKSKKNFEIQAE